MDTKRVTINKVLSNNIMVQQNQYVQVTADISDGNQYFL